MKRIALILALVIGVSFDVPTFGQCPGGTCPTASFGSRFGGRSRFRSRTNTVERGRSSYGSAPIPPGGHGTGQIPTAQLYLAPRPAPCLCLPPPPPVAIQPPVVIAPPIVVQPPPAVIQPPIVIQPPPVAVPTAPAVLVPCQPTVYAVPQATYCPTASYAPSMRSHGGFRTRTRVRERSGSFLRGCILSRLGARLAERSAGRSVYKERTRTAGRFSVRGGC